MVVVKTFCKQLSPFSPTQVCATCVLLYNRCSSTIHKSYLLQKFSVSLDRNVNKIIIYLWWFYHFRYSAITLCFHKWLWDQRWLLDLDYCWFYMDQSYTIPTKNISNCSFIKLLTKTVNLMLKGTAVDICKMVTSSLPYRPKILNKVLLEKIRELTCIQYLILD